MRHDGRAPADPRADADAPATRPAGGVLAVSAAETELLAKMVRRSCTVSAWALAIMVVGLVLAAVGNPGGPPLIAPLPALMAIYAVVLATKAHRRHVWRGAVRARRLGWFTLVFAAIPAVPFLLLATMMSMYQG